MILLRIFKDSKIQRFKDSKIQRFKDSKIQRFKDLKIQRFKDSKIQRLANLQSTKNLQRNLQSYAFAYTSWGLRIDGPTAAASELFAPRRTERQRKRGVNGVTKTASKKTSPKRRQRKRHRNGVDNDVNKAAPTRCGANVGGTPTDIRRQKSVDSRRRCADPSVNSPPEIGRMTTKMWHRAPIRR